jgi:hypothetical protein
MRHELLKGWEVAQRRSSLLYLTSPAMAILEDQRQEREYIFAIEFGIFPPDEIKRRSVCSLTESGMYLAMGGALLR